MIPFTLLALSGFVALAVTVTIGFEEPNGIMLFASGLLLLMAPGTVLVHLAFTRDLTREQKRAWLRALTGRRALHAWSAYLRQRPRRRG